MAAADLVALRDGLRTVRQMGAYATRDVMLAREADSRVLSTTVTDPAKLTATIAAIVRVLGMEQIELAACRASGKPKRRRQTHEVVLRRS